MVLIVTSGTSVAEKSPLTENYKKRSIHNAASMRNVSQTMIHYNTNACSAYHNKVQRNVLLFLNGIVY